MFGCEWFCCNQVPDLYLPELHPEPFSLPSPIPDWPPGQEFASGRINLGQIEVIQVTQFEVAWSCKILRGKTEGVTFYRPVGYPVGFYCLGYYCQPNDQPLRGYVLVARDSNTNMLEGDYIKEFKSDSPALAKPLKYTMIWCTDLQYEGGGYFWQPNPPAGYKAMGIIVTNSPEEPDVEHVRCVRADLTERCETSDLITSVDSESSKQLFQVWNTKPCRMGLYAKGVSIGTFYCSTDLSSEELLLDTACLKNLQNKLPSMPNLDQIHALIKQYGPTVFLHPDEVYMPSSVEWFFKNGALLYQEGKQKGEPIDYRGLNLPSGGENDGEYWIDFPTKDDARNFMKRGDLESGELYVHVKPALGGTFTDIAMWLFCPFNGPATIKIGIMSIQMNKIGEHVGDWEHFTLRVSNFTGELWQVFFSQHSGGQWVNASALEFIEGNRAVVYSSKHGHASFPHAGTYLQGSTKLGVGVRNDAARSKYYVDSSSKYQLIAAEYLGDGVVAEPCWLQYMREWGPTIVYDGRAEIEKIIDHLPLFLRFSLENIFDLLPTEIYGEEGPTGPKEKENWIGDEIC
ncbi:hypothetical protein K2173_015165 [Erythroxylum novogranatense]|uniref:Vacuolar protein sorting-associated protein 62 n=1 Tax=Erythroxylum novogranatense TaxID=1862640 RepID=A0AAV8T1R1_9ROSI|nr:hypothetical protein K2173_015165 [Erythroxylum novogranatense]